MNFEQAVKIVGEHECSWGYEDYLYDAAKLLEASLSDMAELRRFRERAPLVQALIEGVVDYVGDDDGEALNADCDCAVCDLRRAVAPLRVSASTEADGS